MSFLQQIVSSSSGYRPKVCRSPASAIFAKISVKKRILCESCIQMIKFMVGTTYKYQHYCESYQDPFYKRTYQDLEKSAMAGACHLCRVIMGLCWEEQQEKHKEIRYTYVSSPFIIGFKVYLPGFKDIVFEFCTDRLWSMSKTSPREIRLEWSKNKSCQYFGYGISGYSGSEMCFQMLRTWRKLCQSSHEHCVQ